MELSELCAYAEKKYGIKEEHPWPDYPGLSVLMDPKTNLRLVLLMRQYDAAYGVRERCDIRCGNQSAFINLYPFLTIPYRMNGNKWIGVRMDERTSSDVVKRLFDMAVDYAHDRFTIVINHSNDLKKKISPSVTKQFPSGVTNGIPNRILKMQSLYRYENNTYNEKRDNFYRQGKYMENYEDNVYANITFQHYFPTYHDMNISQLRAYFSWRTLLRRGIDKPISTSFACVYIYELLNGIGAKSEKDTIDKIEDFRRRFVDTGLVNQYIDFYLHQWLEEFAISHHMDKSIITRLMWPDELEIDKYLLILKEPDQYEDAEIYKALCSLSNKSLENSPIMKTTGVHLVSEAWRTAIHLDSSLFEELCGKQVENRYYPLSNAVCCEPKIQEDIVIQIDPLREFSCEKGIWKEKEYQRISIKKKLLQGFLHEADRCFRSYLKTGRLLKKKEEDGWATPFMMDVIQADQEAKKPKITIHFNALNTIRQDAAVTRENLLTEEEKEEDTEILENRPAVKEENHEEQLDHILHSLMKGEDVNDYMHDHHLMPSVTADEINNAYFDGIGDSVVTWDGKTMEVVEDYKEDLEEILGGK